MKNSVDIGDRSFAVIFGGRGCEHNVSRVGACNFISAALAQGYDVLPIYIDKDGDFYIYYGSVERIGKIDSELEKAWLAPAFPIRLSSVSGFFTEGRIIRVKLAVPLLHGDFGEDGTIQGLLTSAGISYLGAQTVGGALMCDKAYAKAVAKEHGVEVLPWLEFSKDECDLVKIQKAVKEKIGFPVFIKPTRLGSSVGASLADSESLLVEAVENAFFVTDRIIAERALINKRELECAYLKIGEKEVISFPGEVITGGRVYDYNLKYSGASDVTLEPRARINSKIAEKIQTYTRILADAMSVRHIARFDYFLDDGGVLYFNEVNSFPGMTAGSLYAAMLRESGVDFSELIRLIFSIE